MKVVNLLSGDDIGKKKYRFIFISIFKVENIPID